MIRNRKDLSKANRIVIKAGTSIISTPDGYPSLTRMANIVEYAAKLSREGKEVMIVTSGAVGVGRQRLKKQAMLRQSLSDMITQKSTDLPRFTYIAITSTIFSPTQPLLDRTSSGNLTSIPQEQSKISYSSACAAAGQMGLMSLYETMFNQYEVATSQLLVSNSYRHIQTLA